MSTHAIGRGKCNFPVTLDLERRREIGRLAVIEGSLSTGAWVREVIEERVARAKARGLEIARDARQMILPLGCAIAMGVGLGALCAQLLAGGDEMMARRCRRSGRRRDEVEWLECGSEDLT